MNLSNEELLALRDLVSRIIFQFDFEHQDQDYQDKYNLLDQKLFNLIMRINEPS